MSSRISSIEIKDIIERLRHQHHRESTKNNYYVIWKIFGKFLIGLDHRPSNWEDHLTLFVGHLIENHKQSSTVKSYVSAIKSILLEDKVKLNENQYLISSLTKACQLKNDQIRTRLPIQKGMLKMILRQVIIHFDYINQPYLKQLYLTLFSTMYYGLLRISEVASGGAHLAVARDVQIGQNKRKFLLILQTSKTHWKNNKPQLIKISAEKRTSNIKLKNKPSGEFCPYKLLCDFAKIRGGYNDDSDPFFVFLDGSPILPNRVLLCLKTVIHQAGFDERLYSNHSLRIGRTCDLLKLGLSVQTIKKLGRWKSNAVFRYLRY